MPDGTYRNIQAFRNYFIGPACNESSQKENREGQIPQGVVEWDVEVKNQRNETVATETVLTLVARKEA